MLMISKAVVRGSNLSMVSIRLDDISLASPTDLNPVFTVLKGTKRPSPCTVTGRSLIAYWVSRAQTFPAAEAHN